MAGSKSDYLENALLNYVFRSAALGLDATNLWVGLLTVAPTDAAAGTEVAGGSYARIAVDRTAGASRWAAAAAGLTSNSGATTLPQATADWGTIVAFGIFDAAAAGNLLWWGWLVDPANPASKVFTAKAGTDTLTAPGGTAFAVNDTVRVAPIPGAALPTGLVEGTTYYVKTAAGGDYTLSATQGGATIDITADGGGVIARIVPKQVLNGDIASFAAGGLTVSED